MNEQVTELTETQILADIHNMLSDIHEAMFVEDEAEDELEDSEEESEDAQEDEVSDSDEE